MKFIELQKLNLHYSSLAYKDRSFKSFAFDILKLKRKKDVADVHALKDISFSIKRGEKVGLIGHNGAGKSTLLRTLAGLYPPSSGKIHVQGSIRALFELNLGFESEATGRENIMYRGLLLGNKPQELKKLEDEIIEFAGLGNFIDYPIKTYSAGMLVRLAFAISTSIKGDILLLDEVLGAGDIKFYRKAKERVVELINHAEIMIFASHDFVSLIELCPRTIVLDHGQVIYDGATKEAIAIYKNIMKAD